MNCQVPAASSHKAFFILPSKRDCLNAWSGGGCSANNIALYSVDASKLSDEHVYLLFVQAVFIWSCKSNSSQHSGSYMAKHIGWLSKESEMFQSQTILPTIKC